MASAKKKPIPGPQGQHSIAQLVWHMVTWREFVLSRINPEESKNLHHFEQADWRHSSADSAYTWPEGLRQLQQTQTQLLQVLSVFEETKLEEKVPERTYTFRKLLHGITQHDIYHLGQIAYVVKLLRGKF